VQLLVGKLESDLREGKTALSSVMLQSRLARGVGSSTYPVVVYPLYFREGEVDFVRLFERESSSSSSRVGERFRFDVDGAVDRLFARRSN
jgi:hypothetical protein